MTLIGFLPNPNYELGKNLLAALGAQTGSLELRRFPDGESYVRVTTDVQGTDVFIVAALSQPDPQVPTLVFLARTLRDMGARRVGLVAPYLPYMRQDRRFNPGEGLTSVYFAELISEQFDWLVTVDPHLHRYKALSDVYGIPAVAVEAAPPIAHWIEEHVKTPALIGPDSESAQWVTRIAEMSNATFAVLAKKRHGDTDVEIEVRNVDQLRDRTPVLVDDIISSGETLAEAIRQLNKHQLMAPVCIATHALFAAGATDRLQAAGASRVLSTNSVIHPSNQIDLSGQLSAAVRKFISKENDHAN